MASTNTPRAQYGSAEDPAQSTNLDSDEGALLNVATPDDTSKKAPSSPKGPFEKWMASIGVEPDLAYTLIGVIAGIILGLILTASLPPPGTERSLAVKIIGFPGAIFLNLLKMMVLPLVSGSMIGGVCALKGNGAETGRMARNTLIYFAGTTIIAVILGLILVTVIQPGVGGDLDMLGGDSSAATKSAQVPVMETIFNVMLQMFPSNVLKAAVDMNVLGVITFSLFFGVMLSRLPDATGAPLITLVETFNEVIMRMVMAILQLAPVGIASLIAAQMASSANLGAILRALGLYMSCVILGLLVHGFLILPAVYWALTKKNPYVFMRGVARALATAFGTDSSAATLPVTIMCCQDINGVPADLCRFVLPLGATVNMNGTALYEALTVIFIAQLHNEPLGIGQLIVVAMTSTLAAVGAAAIPSAGLVTMVMVLQSVGLDQYVSDITLVFTIDWLLDRIRTVVNVLGDAYGAGIVHHLSLLEETRRR